MMEEFAKNVSNDSIIYANNPDSKISHHLSKISYQPNQSNFSIISERQQQRKPSMRMSVGMQITDNCGGNVPQIDFDFKHAKEKKITADRVSIASTVSGVSIQNMPRVSKTSQISRASIMSIRKYKTDQKRRKDKIGTSNHFQNKTLLTLDTHDERNMPFGRLTPILSSSRFSRLSRFSKFFGRPSAMTVRQSTMKKEAAVRQSTMKKQAEKSENKTKIEQIRESSTEKVPT
jgi:hypothetical protein